MGLLQKLSESGLDSQIEESPLVDKPVIQKKSNSVGLLKKSLTAGTGENANRRLDFFEFAGKYNLEIFAMLKNNNGNYEINNCCGYDGESICLSVSTPDFWEGTIPMGQKLYTYDAVSQDALPFFQFFSKKFQEKLKTINIIKSKNNSIFIICNNNIPADSSFISDLEAVENTETNFEESNPVVNPLDFADSFKIDFSEALESFVLANSKNDIKFSAVILKELYFNLCKNFPEPEKILFSSKGNFILYVTEKGLPLELLYNHLRVECNFVLGNHSELLSVTKNQASTGAAL